MEKLSVRDYQRVHGAAAADIFLINTCTVTAEGGSQARQQVRRAIRDNPEAWVVVTGCYARWIPRRVPIFPV